MVAPTRSTCSRPARTIEGDLARDDESRQLLSRRLRFREGDDAFPVFDGAGRRAPQGHRFAGALPRRTATQLWLISWRTASGAATTLQVRLPDVERPGLHASGHSIHVRHGEGGPPFSVPTSPCGARTPAHPDGGGLGRRLLSGQRARRRLRVALDPRNKRTHPVRPSGCWSRIAATRANTNDRR